MQWQHWAMQLQCERQVYGCCNLEWLLLTAGATADRVALELGLFGDAFVGSDAMSDRQAALWFPD